MYEQAADRSLVSVFFDLSDLGTSTSINRSTTFFYVVDPTCTRRELDEHPSCARRELVVLGPFQFVLICENLSSMQIIRKSRLSLK